MIGILTVIGMGVDYVAAKKLDDKSDYKVPKGKYKNRYK